MSFFSAISQTIVFLFTTPNPSLGFQPAGTAFIVGYPISTDGTKTIPLIVTAKHVLGDNDKIYARYNTQEGSKTVVVEYDLKKLKKENDFWVHQDEGVDIAVFRALNYKITKYQTLPLDLIASKDDFEKEDVKPADRVIFPGLLVNFMGKENNYPIIKDGTIALIPNEKVPLNYFVGKQPVTTEQELIFINGFSMPGLSGAPVLLWPGPRLINNSFNLGGTKPLLLGVMHGFYEARPRGVIKEVTTGTKYFYQDNSGVAIIFPSWRLKEIFQQSAFLKRMDELKKLVN